MNEKLTGGLFVRLAREKLSKSEVVYYVVVVFEVPGMVVILVSSQNQPGRSLPGENSGPSDIEKISTASIASNTRVANCCSYSVMLATVFDIEKNLKSFYNLSTHQLFLFAELLSSLSTH